MQYWYFYLSKTIEYFLSPLIIRDTLSIDSFLSTTEAGISLYLSPAAQRVYGTLCVQRCGSLASVIDSSYRAWRRERPFYPIKETETLPAVAMVTRATPPGLHASHTRCYEVTASALPASNRV